MRRNAWVKSFVKIKRTNSTKNKCCFIDLTDENVFLDYNKNEYDNFVIKRSMNVLTVRVKHFHKLFIYIPTNCT